MGGRTQANIIVSLMFALWLQVLALTVSPGFHEWLHSESRSLSHECPITLLTKGNLILDSAFHISVTAPVSDAHPGATDNAFFLPAGDYRPYQSRAPPTSQLTLV